MTRRLALLSLTSTMLMTGCSEQGPTSIATDDPQFNTSGCAVNSISLPAGSSHAQIQSAVNSYNQVHLQAGSYTIEKPVLIDGCTEIYGDGQGLTVIRYTRDAGNNTTLPSESGNLFHANVTADGQSISGVTIRDLTVNGDPSSYERAVLFVANASDVTVERVEATRMALIATERFGSAVNSNVTVRSNKGTGPNGTGYRNWPGVTLYHVVGGNVQSNTLADYRHGVLLWGGDADPKHGQYDPDNPPTTYSAGNVDIWYNDIRRVHEGAGNGVGIMTSVAENVRVKHNQVWDCGDLCLDAESSKDVLFEDNDVGYGGNMVIGVYFDAINVQFVNNRIYQASPSAEHPYTNLSLFNSWQGHKPDGTVVYVKEILLSDNKFYWQGAGVGRIWKQGSKRFIFFRNTLENVVVDLYQKGKSDSAGMGYIEITSNTIKLSHRAYSDSTTSSDSNARTYAGIDVGRTHGHDLWINGNTVDSWPYGGTQPLPGIRVLQDAGTPGVTRILENRVRGFPMTIAFSGDGGSCPDTFDVQWNKGDLYPEDIGGSCEQGINANNSIDTAW